MKSTIAITGATNTAGKLLSEQLAAKGFSLLLLSADKEALQTWNSGLQEKFPLVNIDSMQCSYDASWEADILVLNETRQHVLEIAAHVKDVVTRKPVIVLQADENAIPLQEVAAALPHCNIKEATRDTIIPVIEAIYN
jgi:NAD(P)-dependent dehydrogenase (short-subunit alcohol dehydrogenase family)